MKSFKSYLTRCALAGCAALALGATMASAQVLNLWNINFAGNDTDGFIEVTDGTVLSAGSHGGNQWNNVVAPIRDPYTPDSPLSMNNASGGNPISFTWVEDGNAGHHFTRTQNVGDAPLFQGYFGRGGFNTTLQMTDLDSSGVYDLYVYFTWGWDETSVNYTLTAGSASLLEQTLNPVQATSNYDDMADGSNFVIFSGITPDQNGAIHLNAISGNGGFSGVQLTQVPEPSTYAAILGALFLALALWRRRR